MATGDLQDFIARLKSTIPRWFGADLAPILNAVLAGLATAWAGLYSLYLYAAQQTRIRTAAGGWLDLASADFFGSSLPRLANELDTPFRVRILAALLQEKGTRLAIYNAIYHLTGRSPLIFEPMRPADTGGYRLAVGYGAAGAYGSMSMPYQALVTAYRQASAGIPLVAGYGISTGAYRIPSRSDYASIGSIQQVVSDASIYAAVDAVKPAGTQVWVKISN
jgi:hypothetical protein